MKKFHLLSLSILIPLLSSLAGGQTKDNQSEAVLKERSFEVDSKRVKSVHWSIQDGAGIVQIIFPAIRAGEPAPELPATQVWLLQKGGKVAMHSVAPQGVAISMLGFSTPNNMYEFAAPAAASAIAVVVQVADQFFVYSLSPKAKPVVQEGAK